VNENTFAHKQLKTTMKQAETKMPAMHQMHVEWINKLNFYKDELSTLIKRVEEVAERNSDKTILATIEHFQNQFIIQRNEIDTLLHDVKMNEEEILGNFKQNPTAWDHRTAPETDLTDRINVFEKLFKEMHTDLNQFLSKVL
jgi:hypothetical protein